MAKILISYRREDSKFVAGSIHAQLRALLPAPEYEIYFDVDSIPGGQNFRKHLERFVEDCDYVVAVVGPTWLTICDKNGRRRLDNAADWVRIEIGTALKRDIPVIPVLLDREEMPEADQLPDELKEFTVRQNVRIRPYPDFDGDVQRLSRTIQKQEADRLDREAREAQEALRLAREAGEAQEALRLERQSREEETARLAAEHRRQEATRLASEAERRVEREGKRRERWSSLAATFNAWRSYFSPLEFTTRLRRNRDVLQKTEAAHISGQSTVTSEVVTDRAAASERHHIESGARRRSLQVVAVAAILFGVLGVLAIINGSLTSPKTSVGTNRVGDLQPYVSPSTTSAATDASDRAGAFYNSGSMDAAIDNYTEAIRVDPNYARAYNGLAWLRATCAQAKYRDSAQAIEYATKACELSEWKDWTVIDTLAAAYAEKGDFAEAMRWETKAIELASAENDKQMARGHLALYQSDQPVRDVRSAADYYARGNDFDVKGEIDKAIDDYTVAIRLDPQMVDAFIARGLIWHRKGELDKAIDDDTEAIRLDPQSALAYFRRGNAWHWKDEFDKAIDDFMEAIRLDPTNPNAYSRLAWLRVTCPQAKYHDVTQAIGYATKACELSEWKNWDFIDTLAAAYAEKGDLADAVLWEMRAIDVAKAENDKETARGRLAKYQALEEPRSATDFYTRGNNFDAKGEFDKAIVDYTEAIRLDPQMAGAFNARGYARRKKGEFDKAIEDYTEAIRLDPKSVLAYDRRATAWHWKDELDKAIGDFMEAIRLDPKDAFAYSGLAWLRATCQQTKYRDVQQAIEYATKACELSEWKNWDYIDTLAAAYAEKGDFAEAVRWETKAIELAPTENDKQTARGHLTKYQSAQSLQPAGTTEGPAGALPPAPAPLSPTR